MFTYNIYRTALQTINAVGYTWMNLYGSIKHKDSAIHLIRLYQQDVLYGLALRQLL